MSLEKISIAVYVAIILFLSIFGLHRYLMMYLFARHKKDVPRPARRFEELPRITVQLPFYNELHVAERAIEWACRLEYPRDRLEIQVLDDSTDETTEICRRKVLEEQLQGIDIDLLHREDRSEFKAGALKEGLKVAQGEFVAIFDADFLPPPGILHEMVHYLADPEVGMVQSRWGHENREYSALTEVQAIFLDGHVVIEQTARNRSGRFFNFDGTAGMWRKSAIEAGGGWQGDTLGEDVDLSFRTQLAGYRFVFLKDLVCPAELPVDMNSFKSQQRRWVKGHCQIVRKLLARILRSHATFAQKSEAAIQLLRVFSYPCVVVLMLLMLPMIRIEGAERGWAWLWFDLPVFLASTTSVLSFYLYSQRESGVPWKPRVPYLPLLISVGVGISLSNTQAILSALAKKKTEFIRTPKYGVRARADRWLHKRYDGVVGLLPALEIAFGIYQAAAMIEAIRLGRWLSLPFLFLFTLGFLYVGILSIAQPVMRRLERRKVEEVEALVEAPSRDEVALG
ncbi:MAG: glycosyltransferase [Planctomycetes bacterium]|nr:glycosyltransferase [Planctomycetota bacterium]